MVATVNCWTWKKILPRNLRPKRLLTALFWLLFDPFLTLLYCIFMLFYVVLCKSVFFKNDAKMRKKAKNGQKSIKKPQKRYFKAFSRLYNFGAEGGIRTLVWCYPQTDFESAPLWPLRYLCIDMMQQHASYLCRDLWEVAQEHSSWIRFAYPTRRS